MAFPFSLDTGVMELDKLIHSFEFENQQYVKMIDKENQLIISLESQIQSKIQESVRLEEDVSRFDEDTKRLHRLYTNNRDNIENLKNTINVLSDHEAALLRQLEVTRTKTEENRKIYKTHIANYSSIKEDYMNKYTRFPFASELEKKRIDLHAAQKRLDEIKAVKQDLKDKITAKENELDSKLMTRIIVKIAKTKLSTYQLEKEIHECLTEKTNLLEKLTDIRTSKQSEQCEQSGQDYVNNIEKQNMETEHIALMHMDDCERQRSSNGDVEGFSNICISDDYQKSLTSDSLECTPCGKGDEQDVNNTEDGQCSEMNVGTESDWSVLALDDDNLQQAFTSEDMSSGDGDNNTPVSYLHERNVIVNKQNSTVPNSQICAPLPVTITKPLHRISSEDPIVSPFISTVSNTINQLSVRSITSSTLLNKIVFNQQPGQRLTQSIATIDNNRVLLTPSLPVPRLSVPKPPRVPPPPIIRVPSKLPENCNPPPSYAEIKKPLIPPLNTLKDFRQKSLNLPRLPVSSLHHFSKSSELTSTMAEEGLAEPIEWHHQPSSAQASEFQTRSPGYSSGILSSTQVHASLHSPRQLISGNEEPAVEKQITTLKDTDKQNEFDEHFASTEKVTDVEIPVAGCDKSPVKGGKSLFKINNKGSHNPSAGTKSPKGNYPKSPTHEKKSASQGSHSFLFESMFGNFGKNSNEDSTENEEDAPTSIFSLFNMSQNQGSRSAGEESTDGGTFFTLGRFTEDTGSPTSDGGPCNLLNLFAKSQNSESSSHEFAFNLQGGGQEDEKTFKLGEGRKESYFSYGPRCGSDDEGDKPLFNLF